MKREDASSRVASDAGLGFCKGKNGMDSLLNAEPRVGLVGDHKYRTNLMRWVQFAIMLPCLVIGPFAHSADRVAELANGGVMTNVCLSQKCAGVRPIEVRTVKPALFKEGERGIECATKGVGRNAEPGSILACDGQPVRNEQHTTSSSDAEQPKINATQEDAEYVHRSIWGWVAIIVYLLFFQVPENTVLVLQKPNE